MKEKKERNDLQHIQNHFGNTIRKISDINNYNNLLFVFNVRRTSNYILEKCIISGFS